MVAAIILAAGASQRMGSPKALLPIADSTLLQRILEVVKKTCNEIVIVTRKELQVDIMLNAPESRIVTNPMPENGRTGTIQVGLLALEIPTAALIVPVDRPGFNFETIEALLKAGGCVRPVHNGRGGHPVLLDREAIRKVMSAEANASLREILEFNDVQVEGVDFSLNVDRPGDLQKLTQWYVSQDT